MQKLIRIMAIVATGLMALSLVLLLVSMIFQPLYVDMMGYPEAVKEYLPMVPVMELIFGFLQMICVGLLMICCGSKKGGPWLELGVMVALVVVLPFINGFVSGLIGPIIDRLIFGYSGAEMGAAHSLAKTISTMVSSYCLSPANWGKIIAYVACGMSIAFKHMNKKLERVAQQ